VDLLIVITPETIKHTPARISIMHKYIKNVIPWVVKNKLAVMRGGRVDTKCIPFYHVGRNDEQGLREGVGNPNQDCNCKKK